MEKIATLLKEIGAHIPHYDKTNPKVTATSVGWHLEHILLVITNVLKAVEISDPKQYKWEFNFARLMILTMGSIPRGRGKAPKHVEPNPEHITLEALHAHLLDAQAKLALVPNFQPKQHFKHPMFKHLDLKSTLKFLYIHTEHHLKIVRDMLK